MRLSAVLRPGWGPVTATAAVGLFARAGAVNVTEVADRVDISLLGFAGFEAGEHFLRALEEEIWVARWSETGDRSTVSVHRPAGLDTAEAMRAELERPSLVTVISAHAGYFDGRHLGVCGTANWPVLLTDAVGRLGAASMVLIDACYAADLAAALKSCAQPGSLLVGLDTGPDQVTAGRDSVSVLGAVIRELCYYDVADLSPGKVRRAVDSVNAQVAARNLSERQRHVTSPQAMRPLISCTDADVPPPGAAARPG